MAGHDEIINSVNASAYLKKSLAFYQGVLNGLRRQVGGEIRPGGLCLLTSVEASY